MKRWILATLLLLPGCRAAPPHEPEPEGLLLRVRQLTFAGRRSGEGYFAPDGRRMVFQSEREPGNPFFQIYLLDLRTGETRRVSTGVGKATCGWVHGSRVLFASTHLDPEARAKQKAGLEARASGRKRRYAWDFDPHYDLFVRCLDTGRLERLTNAPGYDAEAAFSPDGTKIVFASNRAGPGAGADGIDVYVMNADGSDVKRLTHTPGYDGGPFFGPRGRRICWRRFKPGGNVAEIWLMNADGTGKRRLTDLGALSWAPFFHPSGDYLIFSTNRHGFDNFELYLVDAEGKRKPVRVTRRKGFDGLPAFSPDGTRLAWTSNATPGNRSQIFIAEWNDAYARRLLGLRSRKRPKVRPPRPPVEELRRIRSDIERLASEEMEGRLTGTRGELRAIAYVARAFEAAGLKPAGDAGWFQRFGFTAGVSAGPDNRLEGFELDRDWRPLGFSASGRFGPAKVVFAGYGIVAPGYDSYVHLDVRGRWVMVLRGLPDRAPPEVRQRLARYGTLREKARAARSRGAIGLVVATPPWNGFREPLVPLRFDVSMAGTKLAGLSLSPRAAERLIGKQDLSRLRTGALQRGFVLDRELAVRIDVRREKRYGRNVIGRLDAAPDTDEAVLIGAHVDHLGRGIGTASLAGKGEEGRIHFGADDNASGVAALLYIARTIGHRRLRRDIVFAAWSGEEIGLLGSTHFARRSKGIVAVLNLDMVGRLRDRLILQGTGSSPAWPEWIERANAPIGLPLTLSPNPYLPTDATAFYLRGIPVLSAFTGAHADYHTPRDTADRINVEGVLGAARLMRRLALLLAGAEAVPPCAEFKRPPAGPRVRMRAYLGTIPDYGAAGVTGVRLSGVAKGGPADRAGVRGGDVVVELAGRKIETLQDYAEVIAGLRIGEAVKIVVVRNGRRVERMIVPASRE